MDHYSMLGMTMPFEPKSPVAETVPVPQPQSEPAPMPEMDHGNMPGMEINQADTRPPACAPEHAAMGHCTAEPEPSTPAMTMEEQADAAAAPDSPPDPAKLGHCTQKANARESARDRVRK